MNHNAQTPPETKVDDALGYPILVVEDDAGLNHLIQKNLRRKGFRVQGSLTGQEAIDRVMESPPTMLLLDYDLPDMTAEVS